MDVYLSGGHRISLSQSDLLGQGGEGAVYAHGSHAYKISHDPSKCLPADKVAQLAAIADPRAVAPEDLIFNAKMQVIGHRMPLVQKAVSVCEGMTRAYRTRRGLGQEAYHRHVEELRETLWNVHKAGVVLVDLNDLNVLLLSDTVRIIDLDSAQTRSFPATALQDLVRDPLARGPRFDEGSDWYAFAILAFELFCGAHPFRGSHPKAGTIADRMRLGLSALDSLARLPAAAYPISGIPTNYRGWLEAVLSNKTREAPDLTGRIVATVPHILPAAVAAALAQLIADPLAKYPQIVLRAWGLGGRVVSLLQDGSLRFNSQPTKFRLQPGTKLVVGAARQNLDRAFAAYVDASGMLRIYDLAQDEEVASTLQADEVSTTGSQIIFRQGSAIYELSFVLGRMGASAGARRIGNCMPHATKLGEGAAVQVMLQTLTLSMLSETGQTREVMLPELKGYRPLGVWSAGSVAVIRAAKGRRVDRIIVQVQDDGNHKTTILEDCPDELDLARSSGGVIADGIGDQVRIWRESDPTTFQVFALPPGDYGPLAEHRGHIIAPAGDLVVRLRSR